MKTHKKSAIYNNTVWKGMYKFRVPLKVDPIFQKIKQEWNLQLWRLLRYTYSLSTPSDEQKPFHGGSSRMEIKNNPL